MANDESDPPRTSTLPPGYDEEDPYEGVDLETLPDWWMAGIETFREHRMRPYRPPLFEDEKLTKDVIDRLETDLGVRIQLRTTDPEYEGPWKVWVDDDPVSEIGRTRKSEGRTVYNMTAEEFERVVEDAVRETDQA